MEVPVKKKGCFGGCLTVAFWIIAALVVLTVAVVTIQAVQTAGRAVGLLPTLTPTSPPTVTLTPTVTPLPSATPFPTDTPLPTQTSAPTATAIPSATATVTSTPLPTPTALPTHTPLPPTATPLPASTPTPTATLDPSIPRTDIESRIACNMAEYFVKQRLKSPSTAKFPNLLDELNGEGCLALYNNGVWTISSWVDSQNSFGAMIRTHYVAQLTYMETDETWHLEDLVIVE